MLLAAQAFGIGLLCFGIIALLSSISLIKPSEMRYYDYKNKDQNIKFMRYELSDSEIGREVSAD